MPTIIDSLVVMFGLDPRGFQAGAKTVQDTDRKTRDQLDKSNKVAEVQARKVAGAYKQIGSEIKNLVLVAAGASGIADFVKNIVTGDAATGRLATNLGVATQNVSAWEGAIQRVGGAAGDADAALQSMVSSFQNYKLTGRSGHDADFQGLGVGLSDLADPERALLKIAKAGERMNRPEFVARLQRIGLPESAINLLEKGQQGVQRLLEEQTKLGVVTDRDAEAAQRLTDKLAQFKTQAQGQWRPVITGLVEDFLKLGDAIRGAEMKNSTDGKTPGPLFAPAAKVQNWLNRVISGITFNIPEREKKVWRSWFGSAASPEAAPGVAPPPVSLGTPRTAGRAVALDGNNPGGINDGAWASRQPGYAGSNGRYARFRTMQDGLAAQQSLLRSYVNRGYDTPAKIARRWAPSGDGRNNPNVYASNVARQLGIGVNDRIDGAAIGRFSIAQANQENYQFSAMRGARARPGAPAAAGSTSSHETNIGTIVVNAPGGDPDTIAKKLPHAIQKRGVITQANSGMSG